MKIWRIAVPGRFVEPLDYLACSTETAPQPGARIEVPLGRGKRIGVLVEVAAASALPLARLRPALRVLDIEALFTTRHLVFLRWAARYYHYPLGDALTAALPVLLRQGGEVPEPGLPAWRATSAGAALDLDDLSRAPRQRELLERLRRRPSGLVREGLAEAERRALRILADKGLAESCRIDQQSRASEPEPGPPLHPEQAEAVSALQAALGRHQVFLLAGITGSGKTEVYLRAAETVLARGEAVLFLVPEIGLTPQLVGRVERRLGLPPVVMHSGLNDRERLAAWQATRSGLARLIIGTRSAVFSPVPRLGLIVVDEEHDSSFKQHQGYRYSARDLAVLRGRGEFLDQGDGDQGDGCPVLLGSATPSLETLRNAALGRYRLLRLTERAGSAQPPRLELVDMTAQSVREGLAEPVRKAIGQVLAKGHQVLVFLNRRGFAPVLTCYACGWVSDCHRCDARQTLHAADGLLWCHHCGAQRRIPQRCPGCGGEDLYPLGQGTERLEQSLSSGYPDYPPLRIDRDSTSRKGSLADMLGKAERGEAKLLVGTQMLAKGHHFPNVALVVISDIDQGLMGSDFRGPERMAQLLVQVAGRAGRAEIAGRVMIQTRFPGHPLLQLLIRQGYDAFAKAALDERAQIGLPPTSYQALLRAEGAKPEAPKAFLDAAAQLLSGHDRMVQVLGPIPAAMERRQGRYRANLLLQARQRGELQTLLNLAVAEIAKLREAGRVRWSLDVDPLSEV